MIELKNPEKKFFLFLLWGSIALMTAIFWPYLEALILAVILVVMFDPLYQKLKNWIGSKNVAAFLITLLIVLTVLVPLSLIGYKIFQEGRDIINYIQSPRSTANNLIIKAIDYLNIEPLEKFLSPAKINIAIKNSVSWFTGNLGNFFSASIDILINILILILAIFFLLRDGPKLRDKLLDISPLAPHQEKIIITKLQLAINSIIKGTLIVAALQGLATGLGFLIFGVPNPALWSVVAAIVALIPTIGTSIVTVPGVIYLLLNNQMGLAIGLGIWAFVAVGLLDNILRPEIIGRHSKQHAMLILISVLGGVALFGPLGFMFGPLALSFMLVMTEMYQEINRNYKS